LRILKIENVTKKVTLADKAGIADTCGSRLKGLLGRKDLPKGDGLVIDPCTGIHTIGMKFNIDVLFLDRSSCVIGLRKGITPNHFTRIFWKAKRAVELPVETIEDSATDIGDLIRIEEKTR
jgi:uncharacterized membrane protein (UPF0127 family)